MKATRSGSSILLRAACHLAKQHLIETKPYLEMEDDSAAFAGGLLLRFLTESETKNRLPEDVFRCLRQAIDLAEAEAIEAANRRSVQLGKGRAA